MKASNLWYGLLCMLAVSVSLSSCSDDNGNNDDDRDDTGSKVQLPQVRAFFLNEGSYNGNNAGISFYAPNGDADFISDIYSYQNDAKLGDTTTGTFHRNGQFSGRCGSQVDVDNVPSHTHQGTYHYVLHHFAGETGVTAYYDLVAFYSTRFADECSISRCEFHDVKRVEPLACMAADGSADSRDRFD